MKKRQPKRGGPPARRTEGPKERNKRRKKHYSMAESIISPMERLESSPLKDSWPGAYAHLKKLIQASEANRAKEEAEESGSAISQDENGHNRSKESTSPKQDKDF